MKVHASGPCVFVCLLSIKEKMSKGIKEHKLVLGDNLQHQAFQQASLSS